MSKIVLMIPLLLFMALFIRSIKGKRLIKENMIGNCYAENMPYHSKEVHLENNTLRSKLNAIRRAMMDKGIWESKKINSYIPHSRTQNNDLNVNHQNFPLSVGGVTQYEIKPTVTQFMDVDPHDKTPSYYVSPKYVRKFTKRFNCNVEWAPPPYNSKPIDTNHHKGVLNFQNYP
jgi:hypothetical protein